MSPGAGRGDARRYNDQMPSSQSLLCHPATSSEAIRCLDATVEWRPDGDLKIRYVVRGEIERLAIPAAGRPVRCDGLWERTCFELFIAESGIDGYREFNFSPSSAWACYQFAGYRLGMCLPPVSSPPRISVSASPDCLEVGIELSSVVPDDELATRNLGLCAVLEEYTGNTSYWALRHAAGEPDFHDPSGFVWLLERAGSRSAEPAGHQGTAPQSAVAPARKSG